MKRALAFILSCLLVACAQHGFIPFSPIKQFAPPEFQTFTLTNGITVFYIEDRELPLVNAAFYFKGGALYDSAKEIGLAGALGGMLREGGAGSLNADQLDRVLEDNSITISSAFSEENGAVSLNSLSSDVDKAFALFADVVRRPRFDQQRIDLARKQGVDAIRRRKDNPNSVLSIAFDQLIYGDTVFGRQLMESDLKHITRDALIGEYQRFVHPKGAILTVSGDISREELEGLLNKYFGDWSGERALPLIPKLDFGSSAGIYFIPHDIPQASVVLGEQGVVRLSPDAQAIEVFNRILSGGFGSRLTAEIRTNKGYAYDVDGGISPYVVPGKNYIFFQSKSESVVDAVQSSVNVLSEFKRNGATAEEVSRAKEALLSSYVFKFDRPGDVVARQAILRMLDYPQDYDAQYLKRLKAVDVDAVNKVANDYFNINKFVVVVVGNEAAYTQVAKANADKGSFLGSLPLKRVGFDQGLKLN